MTNLEIFIKFKLMGHWLQLAVVVVNLFVALIISSPLFTAILIVTMCYFIATVMCLQLMLPDIEIDQTPARERTDSQLGIQYTNTTLGYFKLILAIGAFSLTIIGKVI